MPQDKFLKFLLKRVLIDDKVCMYVFIVHAIASCSKYYICIYVCIRNVLRVKEAVVTCFLEAWSLRVTKHCNSYKSVF